MIDAWIGTALAGIGTLFSAHKIIWCWPIWIFSCLIYGGYAWRTDQWALLTLQVIFITANTYGWYQWRHHR